MIIELPDDCVYIMEEHICDIHKKDPSKIAANCTCTITYKQVRKDVQSDNRKKVRDT